MKQIAILCSDEPHHDYLVALLQANFNVVGVVVEPGASQIRRLLHNRRYVDYAYATYHHLRRAFFGLSSYRRNYFADAKAIPVQRSAPKLTVDWINDPRVVEFLTEARPDLTVIIGTSILRQGVLRAAGEMIINIHGGYLPYYRGNHCFFFALYHGEFDKIGSTIHFVDAGIDTGDIIEVVVPPIYTNDTSETLYSRAEKMAIHRLVDWLRYYEQGGTLPRKPQTTRGRLYFTRDRKLYHEITLRLRRASGRLKLPVSANQEKDLPSP